MARSRISRKLPELQVASSLAGISPVTLLRFLDRGVAQNFQPHCAFKAHLLCVDRGLVPAVDEMTP
jgi:hypothetical protein